MPNQTEVAELWVAFKKGDKRAFNALTLLFYDTLYHYGTKLTYDYTLVEDCIQDLFLDMWRRRDFLSETDHVKFYLLKSLRRKIHSEKKFQDKWAEVDEGAVFVGEFSIEAKIIETETNEQRLKKLQQVLAGLSRRQREAIYLKFYQEMDNDQIARMMAIGHQSVRNLIHVAIKELQNAWFTHSPYVY